MLILLFLVSLVSLVSFADEPFVDGPFVEIPSVLFEVNASVGTPEVCRLRGVRPRLLAKSNDKWYGKEIEGLLANIAIA